MIAGLRCNYPKDGPGFFAGSRSDGFCRLRRNQAPLSLYAIVLIFLIDTLSAGIGLSLVARETDQLIRLSTGASPTPPSPAVRNHRIAVRLALESVSAFHWISHFFHVATQL